MKVLLKYGGTRVGDMLHAIPLLKKLKDSNIKCDLAHGSYEADAAKLLKFLGLVDKLHSNTFINDGGNLNVAAITNFVKHIGDMYDNEDTYDAIIVPEESGTFTSNTNICIDFNEVPWASDIVPNVITGDYLKLDNFIGIQAASISGFKTYNELYNVKYPGKVKSFGYSTDKPINNSVKVHGQSLIEVYLQLKTCCMVVSTHSSIGILAYYIGIPQIFIHFWEHVGAHLSERDNILALHKPSLSLLENEIDKFYGEYC
jgi:hypothetical protein